MATNFSSKQPSEAFAIHFDFTYVLGTETIASATITAIDQDTLVDASTTILDVTKQSNTDWMVAGWVQAGVSGHNYIITCKIVGSAGSLYELDGILPVEELPAAEIPAGAVTLFSLLASIKMILQDAAFTDIYLTGQINEAVFNIAAGIRMPDGQVSPPLPDLYKYAVVNTTTSPYVSLPVDYQRKVFSVCDDTLYQILSPRGGDYYAFNKFLQQINKMDFSEAGSIYRVCVRGTKLYYQGIPSAPFPLGIHYYRKPTILSLDNDTVDAFASFDHLTTSLVKHYVLKDIMGEKIEDGQDNTGIGTKYHTAKFFEAMTDLIDFIGITDASPMYYGEGGYEDRGIVD
jgi:hypothetical protein